MPYFHFQQHPNEKVILLTNKDRQVLNIGIGSSLNVWELNGCQNTKLIKTHSKFELGASDFACWIK